MVVIIENPSGITAGSRMVGTPICLVRRPINPGPQAYRAIALPLSYDSWQLHLSFLLIRHFRGLRT